MTAHSGMERFNLEDFTVEKMARRVTDFWDKGLLYIPFADHAGPKDAVQDSRVFGDGIDDRTSGKMSLPYLPRAGANRKENNGHYTFEEFYPVDATAESQSKNWFTFLHPADREFLGLGELELSDSESDLEVLKNAVKEVVLPSFVNAKDAEKYRNGLVRFFQYLNGDPDAHYDDAIYPSVAQPFMGDLHNPKILVVTFNPGFHEFSDWALGAPVSQLARATQQKLKNNENLASTFDREHSRQQWIREQNALLAAITDRGPAFVPWQQKDGTVPNFAFDPPLNCHAETMAQWGYENSNAAITGNWHTEYFRVSQQNISPDRANRIRDLIPQEAAGDSAGLAQVDIFPYATRNSNDVKDLVGALNKNSSARGLDLYREFRADLWPSQRPILDYILATLLTAADNGTIVVCRSSVVGKNYWPIVMEIAGALAEKKGLSSGSLRKRCFVFSSQQHAHLTLGNIRRYRPDGEGAKPTRQDIADLLRPS